MNNIVVAIEFDEELNDVIEFTADLVRDKKAEVHVVHAYQAHSEIIDYAPQMIQTIESYEEYLQKQAESVHQVVSTLKDRGIRAHGFMKPIEKNVVSTIIDFSVGHKADLIVVGTHHPKRIERMILGSVTEKVIRQSKIPVAVVPRQS